MSLHDDGRNQCLGWPGARSRLRPCYFLEGANSCRVMIAEPALSQPSWSDNIIFFISRISKVVSGTSKDFLVHTKRDKKLFPELCSLIDTSKFLFSCLLLSFQGHVLFAVLSRSRLIFLYFYTQVNFLKKTHKIKQIPERKYLLFQDTACHFAGKHGQRTKV